MITPENDQREVSRIYFSQNECATGLLIQPAHSEIAETVNILDLSVKGLCLSLQRDKNEQSNYKIAAGERFVLLIITSPADLSFVTELELEIRWVFDHSELGHIAMGCQFVQPLQDVVRGIETFVENWIPQEEVVG